MAENPLLPNAELRSLHALLARASSLPPASPPGPVQGKVTRRRSTANSLTGREALFAGTLLQLRGGDLVVPQSADQASCSALLSHPGARPAGESACVQTFGKGAARLALSAGLASAFHRSGGEHLVLAFMQAGFAEPQWAEALAWAQSELLPLIVVCVDASGSDALRPSQASEAGVPDWMTVQRTAGRLKLPILTVDGQDAVAVYRVMQESVLRARSQGGPALLWAVLPSEKEREKARAGSVSPLAHLEHYLRTRKISFSPPRK